MDPKEEIEMEQDDSLTSSPRPMRKPIAIKLKSNKSPSTGRRKTKGSRSSKKDENNGTGQTAEAEVVDTPIFKPMDPGEPVHQSKRLCWDHKVNLIGEKVVDPMIHCCEKCSLPILIYGRMIQCKHVFCFTCAKETEKTCPRCKDPVQRIEQSALGTVFLCTYGGSKHSNDGCRRTYLSQRDLNAHIQHRHLKAEGRSLEQPGTKASGAPQMQRQQLPQPPPKQTVSPASAQALLEQFTAAVRQAHAAQAAQTAQALREVQAQAAQAAQAVSSRTSQEDPYQRSKDISHMTPPAAVSSAPMGPPHQMLHQSAPHQSHATPYGQSGMPPVQPTSHPPASPGLPPQLSSAHDNYPSSIPVMTGGRTNVTNLITVPIQDNDYGRKQEQQHPPQQPGFPGHPPPGGMPPPMNFPPPPMGQMPPRYPPSSMPPGMHQPPPGMPPPFSSQSVIGAPMAPPIHSGSRPPPHSLPPGGPPMGPGSAGAPHMGPGSAPNQGPHGRPQGMLPPPGGPSRFPPPGGQPPRAPWPGGPPPRGPPGPGGPRGPAAGLPPPRPPQRADYNYY